MDNNSETPAQTSPASPQALKALESLRMRLLDLTARNRLINFRHTKGSSLRVIDELPDQLAETLLKDAEMRFLAVPEPSQEGLIEAGYLGQDPETGELERLRNEPNAEEWARHLGLATSYEVPSESVEGDGRKHADKAIQTLLYPHELEARLKGLYQAAESAIEEMGANILYLTFGFLEWYESPSSDAARRAPLFLLPARLHKGRLNPKTHTYEYTLSYSGEEIIPNLSLREKLHVDFGMALPELDEETTPEAYLARVQALIEETQPRWRVRRYISLTLLNFSKLLMYLDLDPARWPEGASIAGHAVVSRFLEGYEEEPQAVGDNLGFGEEHPIDELEGVHERYPLIDDADSSQHSALIDAVDGRNLVIEGPPGTGKSQTITNLIAAAMAQGKKVLFVAEKLAALEVVRSRLDRVGLGEFCLELHSHKSRKQRVLEEIRARLHSQGNYRTPDQIALEIERYENLKEQLKAHAERINRPWKATGKTLHEIFMAATRYRHEIDIAPQALHPEGWNGENYDPEAQRRNRDQVAAFAKVYQAVLEQLENQPEGGAALTDHPWCGVGNGELQTFDLDPIKTLLSDWQGALQRLASLREELAADLACEPDELGDTAPAFARLLTDLERLPPLAGDELLDRLPLLRGEVLEKTQRYLELFLEIQSLFAALGEQVDHQLLEDLSAVDQLIQASARLQELVGEQVELGRLAEALNRLSALADQIDELHEALEGLSQALGPQASEHLALSEQGLGEFRQAIQLIAALDPGYWQHRDDRFDNDELDSLLPPLRQRVEELRRQRDGLAPTFLLDRLDAAGELEEIRRTLASGGLFKWFKGDWRDARKRLLGLSSRPKASLDALTEQLPALIRFDAGQRELAENGDYRRTLGEHFQGLDSDLERLEGLRGWYREIRGHYGIGFGAKVAMGDALLALPPSAGKAVRSLSERGVARRLDDILDDLASLKEVFAPVAELRNPETLLFGEQGLIPNLNQSVQAAIRACGPLVEDHNLSLAGLADRIEQLGRLQQRSEIWREADYDGRLFDGRLGLQLGLGKDNQAGLSRLANTLKLAQVIDNDLHHPPLVRYLLDHPQAASFEALKGRHRELGQAFADHHQRYQTFAERLRIDWDQWIARSGDTFAPLIARNQRALERGHTLQGWLDYVRMRERCAGLGLAALIRALEQGELPLAQLEPAYQAGIHDLLAREILRQEAQLERFSGHAQEALQEQFAGYDNTLKRLQCERIAWKIDQHPIPAGVRGGRVRDLSERYLLEHEASKRTRHIPIRQLLERASNALVALKPCFMMGPMSVAQYLAPGQIEFDLVVMDEASQIKPQDALGAIARGAQLVVVGDPKQLPPTSFFDRVVEQDDDEATAIEESESILDATLPMFDLRRLRWHYRSRHQSLIAFSNHSFYDGNLVLFPSPWKATADHGVQYSRIPRGCFVNRRNMEEARVISEAVREHFRHRPEETLGVVAMSAEQRLQLERAIEALAKEDPAFQEQLERDGQRYESLFVKNLENVQGDERDVIFISMTYGPQEPGGRVYQRFGPINSDVGHRRLNVLFTRSRQRMHIFSSMDSEDILISPSSKRGVKALRGFLSYCETGILHAHERHTGKRPDSDFEIAVMRALGKEGFECIPQVGVAGFFIDVAVLDPGNPGRYLMGIECDGATYHSGKSARDRDRLRQAVLERLGWRIRRIWSTDWFKNPQGELIPILRELHALKTPLPPEGAEISEAETESESAEIEAIIDQTEIEEAQEQEAIRGGGDLRDKLRRFDQKVIRPAHPNTPDHQRLLRPAMIEALLEYQPTSHAEFLELIPAYIRQASEATEGRYLDAVFEIINNASEG